MKEGRLHQWLVSRLLFTAISFFCFQSAAAVSAALKVTIDAVSPLSISVFEQGERTVLLVLEDGDGKKGGEFADAQLIDMDGDGTDEVFAMFGLQGMVNVCGRAFFYDRQKKAMRELLFPNSSPCMLRKAGEFLVSSFRDGGLWRENVYRVRKGSVQTVMSDSCVGCGEVTRVEYQSDGSQKSYLVSDEERFEDRVPL